MSQDPLDPSISISSTKFQTVYAAALKGYKEKTKKDIDSHPLAAELKSCDSPNAVLTVLQSQVQKFDSSETANGRWAKLLDPTVTVLYTCSGFISNVTGPVNCEKFPLEAYPLTWVIAGITTRRGGFHWNWSLTPSEYLP